LGTKQDLIAARHGMRVQQQDQSDADAQAGELREQVAGDGVRGDAGEGVGERPADRDGGVGEAGGAGEEVGGTDVGVLVTVLSPAPIGGG